MLGSWIVVWGSVSCVGTDRWNNGTLYISIGYILLHNIDCGDLAAYAA